MGDILAARAAVEQWGRRRDCRRAEIIGRKGWERVLPGYAARATVFHKEL